MPQQPALVVFSHLRWNFVFQRPQHLLSRLAKRRRVLFIEEPLESATGEAHWEIDAPEPNVKVCRPRTLSSAPGFHAGQLPGLATMVDDLLHAEGVDKYVLWFYSPMAVPLAQSLRREAIDLRLHGRAVGVLACAAGVAPSRSRAAPACGRGIHGRAQPLPGQEGSPSKSLLFPQQCLKWAISCKLS